MKINVVVISYHLAIIRKSPSVGTKQVYVFS